MAFQNPLSFYERLYLRFFYFVRSLRYDLPENQVGWRSRLNQETRFKALMEIGDLEGRTVLDLGCGLGCLYGYLQGLGWRGDYSGIDVLDGMVKRAAARFPGVPFEKRDILRDPPTRQWDYVLINGVFNHKVRDNWGWIEKMVKASLGLARKGLAFNLLNIESGWLDTELFYVRPEELERKVRLWSEGNYKIMKGRLPEDITVFVYHPEGT